ncbi:MAG: M48 family metallopeptidase [Candidatus Thiodiazotropha sp. 6PLUC2]
MKYSNPKIPEGINTSKQHPIKEFILLTGGVIGLIAIAVLVLGLFADRLAHHIPFEMEQKIASSDLIEDSEPGPMQDYLASLAEKIITAQDLSSEMSITVHYLDEETVNAFATLGGHIFIYRGLIEKLPNENSLVMVLAHEIAHIKHRHPIRSLGRGITIGLALSMVNNSLGDMMVDQIVGNTGMLTALTFSREQERKSDETALETLISIYGNVSGADQLFEVLQASEGSLGMPEFFSTHPLSENRIQNIRDFSKQLSANADYVETAPLPDEFEQWLSLNSADEAEQKEDE